MSRDLKRELTLDEVAQVGGGGCATMDHGDDKIDDMPVPPHGGDSTPMGSNNNNTCPHKV
ncbi:MAG TPA: hypothetical protein VKT70_07895 [Stellaceae bacterium]|nr:hypothetical protein [Stellaceae bacterium]